MQALRTVVLNVYNPENNRMAARRPVRRSPRLNKQHSSENDLESSDSYRGDDQPLIPQDDPEFTKERDRDSSLWGDRHNIGLLMFLYVLQGIPLGLTGSIPYLLSGRNVSYKDQAMFSFAYWPFSVKLLWAPIVDAVYSTGFGRRKSWLVPTQYLIGIFMFVLSFHISDMLGEGDGKVGGDVNVLFITTVFFMLDFLAATQDIAVDGWALTMLHRKNVGWASTCNTVGQTAGYFLGNIVFMALESKDFCNKYLRDEPSEQGVVTLAGFMYFWGMVFFATTTMVMFFKRETISMLEEEPEEGVVQAYKTLWRVIRLPSVLQLMGILLTVKIGFAAADSVTGLKLIEEGIPRDKLALIGVPMVPLQIILALGISKYTAGPRPMNVFLKAMPFRLIMGLVFAAVVSWAPHTKLGPGEYPTKFYLVVILVFALQQIPLYCMFVAHMAFHAQVSDPSIGGTYMTLLNTVSNLGGNWPATVALWLVDPLSWKACQGFDSECNTAEQQQVCTAGGGTCHTDIDGYNILSVVCCVIGFIWLVLMGRKVKRLQELPAAAWSVSLT